MYSAREIRKRRKKKNLDEEETHTQTKNDQKR
jgi:hypothetical protein